MEIVFMSEPYIVILVDDMKYIDFIIEIGMGVDLMGGDVQASVERAINDIVHRVCIPFFREKNISMRDAKIVIEVYTPYSEKVVEEKIIESLLVKPRNLVIRILHGGAKTIGIEEIIVSIVIIKIKIPEKLS